MPRPAPVMTVTAPSSLATGSAPICSAAVLMSGTLRLLIEDIPSRHWLQAQP
jgi:hypothetical protein